MATQMLGSTAVNLGGSNFQQLIAREPSPQGFILPTQVPGSILAGLGGFGFMQVLFKNIENVEQVHRLLVDVKNKNQQQTNSSF